MNSRHSVRRTWLVLSLIGIGLWGVLNWDRSSSPSTIDAANSWDYKIVRPLADQGDARAENQLGNMYFIGSDVPQDCAEAVNWYRKAAEQGYALAQFHLGLMYDEGGQGVPEDRAEAVNWY